MREDRIVHSGPSRMSVETSLSLDTNDIPTLCKNVARGYKEYAAR